MRVELLTVLLVASGATLASPFLSFPPAGKPFSPQKHTQTKTPSKRIPLVVSQFDSAPDGFATLAVGFNNQLFTPIIVKRGESLELAVENRLDNDETGIHIHGLFQNGTNYYDGVPGITQCPIGVNRTFSQFISTDLQHGTYWYHSHHKAQYAKGLRSPFIILDPENEPYTKDYDDEYIVMFNEWYHARTPSDLLDPFLSVNNSVGAEPVPQSIQINGKGRVDCKKLDAKLRSKCTPGAPYETFDFTPGKTYRLRLINAGSMGSFNVSIDGHSLTIIEADGVDTQKKTVDVLRMGTGQRYSVLVTAKAKPGNYWLRTTVDTSLWTQFESNVLDPVGKAIIHYCNVPVKEPTSRDTSKNMLDPYSIKPFDTSLQPPPSTVDVRVMFLIVPNENDESRAYVQVDGDFDYNQYVEVREPVLFSTARGIPVNNSANLVRIQKGDVVDLTIYNDDAMPHTFHLHGHNFWVMRHGHTINLRNGKPGNPKELLSKRGFNQEEDLENLYPIHDSIEVPPCVIKNANAGEGGICGGTKGYIVLRYIADNPGTWLLHCHMLWHNLQGLVVTMVEGEKEIKSQGLRSIPREVLATCPADLRLEYSKIRSNH